MTLIAKFEVNGSPILISDLLASQDNDPLRPTALPLAGVARSISDGAREVYFTGLAQKNALIGGNFVIAFAGDPTQAKDIAETLRLAARDEAMSIEIYDRAMTTVAPERRSRLSYIALLYSVDNADPPTSLLTTLRSADIQPSFGGPLGPLLVAGTGAAMFMGSLSDAVGQLKIYDHFPDGLGAVMFALGQIAGALGNELKTPTNLLEKWGAGFEIVALHEGGIFKKVGDVLFLFWEVVQEGGGYRLQLNPKFMKIDYWRDFLIIRVRDLTDDEQGNGPIWTDRVHAIGPMLEANEFKVSEFSMPPLDSTYTCSFVEPPPEDGRDAPIFSQVRFHARSAQGFKELDDNKIIELISQSLLADVVRAAEQHFGYSLT
jgi:hypothetical protein